jgi:HSP20 family protein
MTFVKVNNRTLNSNGNSLMENLFNGFPFVLADQSPVVPGSGSVAVNIRETKDAFVLDIIVPGFDKNDIKINLEKNILTISGEKKNEENDESIKHVRSEYKFSSFKRSFTIAKEINDADIDAKYESGVLTLNLPKKVESKELPKNISIK